MGVLQQVDFFPSGSFDENIILCGTFDQRDVFLLFCIHGLLLAYIGNIVA